MSKSIKSATVSNSAASVDFNKEISGLLNDNAHAMGRELKLAVAVYNDPASFPIANILGGVGVKSKQVAMKNALLVHSEAFKLHSGKADIAKKAASQKSMKGFAAKSDYEAAHRVVTAAISMFERALTAAYFFQIVGAVIVKVTDKAVTLRVTRNATIGNATYENGASDTFTRKSAYELGRKIGTENGIFTAKSVTKKAKGDVLSTGKQSAILESANTFASTLAALPKAEKIDISTSAGFETMLATSIRARFADDANTIDVADIVEFLRKSDVLTGVRIDAGKPSKAVKSA